MDITVFEERVEQIIHMIRLLQFALREDKSESTAGLDHDPSNGWAKIKQALEEKCASPEIGTSYARCVCDEAP